MLLAAGHSAMATDRNPERSRTAIGARENLLTVALDITDPAAAGDELLWSAERHARGASGDAQKHSGQFITITSAAGLIGQEFCAAYAASTFALEGWMESLHFDVEHFGISTMAVGFFRPKEFLIRRVKSPVCRTTLNGPYPSTRSVAVSEHPGGGSEQLQVETAVRNMVIPAGVAGPEPLAIDVRCYAVAQPAGIVIIDTGMPDAEAGIAAAVQALGGSFDDVRDIIITHSHPDHIGALSALTERAPLAAVYAGGPDAQDIRAPHGVTPIGEGTVIQGFEVLATPGHTAGHVCLFHQPTGTLFIGDAAASVRGEATRPPEMFTADAVRAEESLARIAELGPARILFSHGPELDAPAQALGRLVGGTNPPA